jgi:hypothetical protein
MSALHLLLVAALAAPPVTADPSACAEDDLRCNGTVYVESARNAKSGEERAQYLYSAHRALLLHFDHSQDSADLCQAHELIRQARKGATGELAERIAASEQETQSRLRSSGVDCGTGRGNGRGTGRVRRKDRPVAALVTTPEPPARESSELVPVPTATTTGPSKPPQPEPVRSAPLAPPPLAADRFVEHRGPVFPQPAPGPFKPLLIGGGVALAAGLALGGLSVYYATTGIATRQRCLDEPCSVLHGTDDLIKYDSKKLSYGQYIDRAWITGAAGAAVLVTAVVLLAVGGRRRAKNLALGPMLRPNAGGVLITGRF